MRKSYTQVIEANDLIFVEEACEPLIVAGPWLGAVITKSLTTAPRPGEIDISAIVVDALGAEISDIKYCLKAWSPSRPWDKITILRRKGQPVTRCFYPPASPETMHD